MEKNQVKKVLFVDGMTCSSCELKIEKTLQKLQGIAKVKASFAQGTVEVLYDENEVELSHIIQVINQLDYKVMPNKAPKSHIASKISVNKWIGIGIIILAVYTIINKTIGFNFIPQISSDMGYGILFLIGILTSLHCVAMCGGINLSQCVKYRQVEDYDNALSKVLPSILYNSGRVVSYTLIGGIVGTIGSVISFSGAAKGIVAIIAGVFMVIMGVNLLGIFPWLRRFNPRIPRFLGKKINDNASNNGPFFVGLLNGLMPCGPLQAMQLYALGTGSFFAGATSMFFFSIGTVPLMFGFGAISSYLSQKFTRDMIKVSGLLVIVLGVIMAGRGLNLSGLNIISQAIETSGTSSIAQIEDDVQYVRTSLESGKYTPITVQKGIPVKWVIEAAESDLNGCNNEIIIPKYNIQKKLVPGENLIEFTPNEEGTISYTCWMGMIRSEINSVSDLSTLTEEDTKQSDNILENGLPSDQGAGGCCFAGSKATEFANGNIPTDNIQIAEIKDNQQVVTITVNEYGYAPAALVIQKGVETKIKFITEQLNSCNNVVIFPEYNGQLNLEEESETPWLIPEHDFTFQCWMGMLNGYIKVVDDINNINLDEIKSEIDNYTPVSGAGCCGN